jgi:hypothetical protein
MIKAGIKKNQFPSLPPKKTHFISVVNCRSQITLEHKNSRQFQAPEDEERKHIIYRINEQYWGLSFLPSSLLMHQ